MALFSRLKGKGRRDNRPSSAGATREVIDDVVGSDQMERSGLFILEEQQADTLNAVDIIAVHGLGGHWQNTWTDENGKLWLRDFLPVQLKSLGVNARIMSFGYNSDTAFSKAVTDLDDEAAMLLDRMDGERLSTTERNRPIIFIAHSLGGILVKKAMILAHERSSVYGDMLTQVKATVFFGVPHRGSDVAFWASFAANLLKYGQLGFRTNTTYVTALQRNSQTFSDIAQQFIERAAGLRIRTFIETEKMGNLLIVDRDSAVLGLSNEIAVGVAGANHKTMCKFTSASSMKYKPVGAAISRVCSELNSQQRQDTDSNLATPTTILQVGGRSATGFESGDDEATRIDANRAEFVRALLITDPVDDLASVNRERGRIMSGSCEWVLQQQEYSSWLSRPGLQTLKVVGSPGIGKTTLARFLLQRIQNDKAGDGNSVTIYYFCDNRDENRRTPASVLRSLILQILRLRPKSFALIHDDYDLRRDKEELLLNLQTLWRYFYVLAEQFKDGSLFILIDALDELDPSLRESFLQLLSELPDPTSSSSFSSRDVKVLVATRLEPDIECLLDQHWTALLVNADKINEDLSRYVTEQVGNLASKQSYPDDLKTDLEAALANQAGGTFLWVSFVLKELAKARKYEVRARLKDLPKGLDDIYERILRKIGPSYMDDAKFVLKWMVAARQPLTVVELSTAYGLHKNLWNARSLPSASQIEELSDVYKSCESLLFIDSEKQTVNLIHQSVKDFLLGERLKSSDDISKYAVDTKEANMLALDNCWTYFEFEEFDKGHQIIARTDNKLQARTAYWDLEADAPIPKKFLYYAGKNWADHARLCGSIPIDSGCWDTKKLNNLPTLRDAWLITSIVDSNIDMVRFLYEAGAFINVSGVNGKSPLNTAIESRDRNLIEFLLDHGADLDDEDATGRTALHLAATVGDSNTVKSLRARGAKLLSTTSRLYQQVPRPVSTRHEAEILQDSGKPIPSVLKAHFYQEGRLTEQQAIQIIHQATALFRSEPTVVELPTPISICGSIHGQFYDLLKVFEICDTPEGAKYLFLGGYVGKGDFCVECLLYLYALKVRNPQNFVLLRGNYESSWLTDNFDFDFRSECLQKYSTPVYQAFVESFCAMPLAAVVSNQFLCVHGGLSPELHTINDIRSLDRFREPPRSGLMCDILWSRPSKDFDNELTTADFFSPRKEAKRSFYYSYTAVQAFLENNKLLSIIIGSLYEEIGYRSYRKKPDGFPSLIGLFGAPDYLDSSNKAAVMRYDGAIINIHQYLSAIHPYWLPGFMDVFSWSLPFLAEKMGDLAGTLCNDDDATADFSTSTSPLIRRASAPAVPFVSSWQLGSSHSASSFPFPPKTQRLDAGKVSLFHELDGSLPDVKKRTLMMKIVDWKAFDLDVPPEAGEEEDNVNDRKDGKADGDDENDGKRKKGTGKEEPGKEDKENQPRPPRISPEP